ncbi:hypothetical protein [Blastococcus capsensis]|uniref:hypothetical protein n=1 Tax=Blastococcus capsensis TaxID=1564163 RepID=UPI002540A876|nr:hypothetical protein [Blastococcus capsensis]MDK3256589.1 hypothetical protein [Blastococcus capsensis]
MPCVRAQARISADDAGRAGTGRPGAKSTQIAADGIGLCHGELSDMRGSIGEVAQPLLVQAR